MQCVWSKDGVCQTFVLYSSGKPLVCDGKHSACLGQVGRVWDVRDGPCPRPGKTEFT